jgi:hypothetical protein
MTPAFRRAAHLRGSSANHSYDERTTKLGKLPVPGVARARSFLFAADTITSNGETCVADDHALKSSDHGLRGALPGRQAGRHAKMVTPQLLLRKAEFIWKTEPFPKVNATGPGDCRQDAEQKKYGKLQLG